MVRKDAEGPFRVAHRRKIADYTHCPTAHKQPSSFRRTAEAAVPTSVVVIPYPFVVKANVSSVFCSTSCALALPVAGLALELRFTESRGARPRCFEAREHVEESSHVGRFFLHPYDVAALAVALEFRGEFFFWKGIHLFQKNNRGAVVFALLALGPEFVADLPGADQDAVGLADLPYPESRSGNLTGKIRDGRGSVGMAQHTFGREDDQRFSPVAQSLTAQQMEILRGVRGLARSECYLGRRVAKIARCARWSAPVPGPHSRAAKATPGPRAGST